MSSREMVKERATAGRGTLSACMVIQSEHGGGEMQNLCDA